MAIKENALPVGTTSGSGTYIRTVSSGGESQKTPFDVVKGAVTEDMDVALDQIQTELDGKVDKVAGKGLSTEDFTSAEKAKLAGVQAGAQVNPTIDAALSATSTNPVQNKAIATEITDLKEDLSNKAEQDGNYPGMTVGTAEAVLSDSYVEDKVPYLFRRSGGGLAIGNREFDKIVGGTVGWNQMEKLNRTTETKNGITFTKNEDGSYTLDGTATGTDDFFPSSVSGASPVINGHKYLLLSTMPTNISGFQLTVAIGGIRKVRVNSDWLIYAPTSESGKINLGYHVESGTVLSNVTVWSCLFDLTAMFGSTIADYIYSLEQATAGAGMAWLKEHFPKMFTQYQPYDAGTLKSVEGLQSHDTVGFNAWNEEWEVGSISESTGQDVSDPTRIRSKGYNPCLPNTTYYVKEPTNSYNVQISWYDADYNFISVSGWSSNQIRISPANAYYFRFKVGEAYGTTYKNDICINLSWEGERDGEYEPYEEHNYPLDPDLELRGIPKLDEFNNLYYDGDIYSSDGTVERKYGVISFNGASTEYWNVSLGGTHYRAYITRNEWKPFAGLYSAICDTIICNSFVNGSWDDVYAGKSVVGMTGNNIGFGIDALGITNASDFKTWLASHPITLVYELATPTTEVAEPFTNPQIVDPDGTEQYVSTGIVPVGHETKYPADLLKKIENIPDAPTADGTYVLTVTVSGGTATYSWTAK